MEFKELLTEYENLKWELKRNRNRQQELRELGDFPKSNDAQMPKSNNVSSKVENFVIAVIELEDEEQILQQKIIECSRKLNDFTCLIRDVRCRIVVEEKLVHNKTWKEIANNNFYSISNARKLYYAGIKEVQL